MRFAAGDVAWKCSPNGGVCVVLGCAGKNVSQLSRRNCGEVPDPVSTLVATTKKQSWVPGASDAPRGTCRSGTA